VGKQFSDFKKELNEVAVETLAPITKEMRKLLEDKTYLTGIIKDGGNRANIIAQPIITKVKDIVGLY
jgi:tryptophanyl-tRNA synthetase